MISRKTGLAVMGVITVVLIAVAFSLPRIPQPQSYHQFADQRGLWGVPNFGDVASNVGFAVVGSWGLVWLLGLLGLVGLRS